MEQCPVGGVLIILDLLREPRPNYTQEEAWKNDTAAGGPRDYLATHVQL